MFSFRVSSSYEYYAISVEKYSRPLKEDGVDSTPGGNSVVAFIASEEDTNVTITPSQDVEIIPDTSVYTSKTDTRQGKSSVSLQP